MRGACRSRTGVRGFAGLCLTTRPRRQKKEANLILSFLLQITPFLKTVFLAPLYEALQASA